MKANEPGFIPQRVPLWVITQRVKARSRWQERGAVCTVWEGRKESDVLRVIQREWEALGSAYNLGRKPCGSWRQNSSFLQQTVSLSVSLVQTLRMQPLHKGTWPKTTEKIPLLMLPINPEYQFSLSVHKAILFSVWFSKALGCLSTLLSLAWETQWSPGSPWVVCDGTRFIITCRSGFHKTAVSSCSWCNKWHCVYDKYPTEVSLSQEPPTSCPWALWILPSALKKWVEPDNLGIWLAVQIKRQPV